MFVKLMAAAADCLLFDLYKNSEDDGWRTRSVEEFLLK